MGGGKGVRGLCPLPHPRLGVHRPLGAKAAVNNLRLDGAVLGDGVGRRHLPHPGPHPRLGVHLEGRGQGGTT